MKNGGCEHLCTQLAHDDGFYCSCRAGWEVQEGEPKRCAGTNNSRPERTDRREGAGRGGAGRGGAGRGGAGRGGAGRGGAGRGGYY